jgi:hypothetical protein
MVSEIVFSDVLSMAQTVGIIGTMVLTLYFYETRSALPEFFVIWTIKSIG